MSQGCKGPHGQPTFITMDNLEGCFNSLVAAAVAGKDDLRYLVEVNLALTKTVANLTDTNAHLGRRLEAGRTAVAVVVGVALVKETIPKESGTRIASARCGTRRTSISSLRKKEKKRAS